MNEVDVRIIANDRVAAAEYRTLRESVGWRTVDADDDRLQSALDATWNATAREPSGALAGLVRVADDGLLYASIWDMIVRSDLQRRGLGKRLLRVSLDRVAERYLVALVATPAGADLYRAAGFSERSLSSVALCWRPTE